MNDYPIQAVPFTAVNIQDDFWQKKLETVRTITIPSVFRKCENEGRIDNFRRAAKQLPGPFVGKMPFDDTDVYKAVEGASYSLALYDDRKLDAYLDTVIGYIAAAQESDGYLYTNRTIDPGHVHPFAGKQRWSSLVQSHELYDCGHLYEAAAAHYQATGKRTLLDVALKNARLVCSTFGPDGRHDVPGHEIIEMGLVRLYRVTGDRTFLETAQFFLEQRGCHQNRARYDFDNIPEYSQDHIPVLQQTEAVGHAVRAMYLYCGMTDIAAITGDARYGAALNALWNNCVSKKTYLTGGIGSRRQGESFGANYELPNATAYNETCAAIGSVLWNYRMFLMYGNGSYYDIIEQTLYNGLLSGISLSGDRFFYTNPLESDGTTQFNYGSATRKEWFDVSCCPTNLSRFLPSLGKYIYAVKGTTVYVNLYVSGTTEITTSDGIFKLTTDTKYPWDGHIRLTVSIPKKTQSGTVNLRLPGWTEGAVMGGKLYRSTPLSGTTEAPYSLTVNGEPFSADRKNGYLKMDRTWTDGDTIQLYLPLPVQFVRCDDQVVENRGQLALQRGPVVYCIEEQDCAVPLEQITAGRFTAAAASFRKDFLGGVTLLSGEGVTAVPYYAWSNRGVGKMKVWIPEH
ncbi:MAG: glycoside hydrolase family 127 protein [Treponema sp.]|jgi:DUF1680 family protein|nr:glycoside hydrolase family 127 protein [Treponema sp.]